MESLLGRRLVSGNHSIKYNASGLPSGMYFYSIVVSGMNGESLFHQPKNGTNEIIGLDNHLKKISCDTC